MSIRNIDDSVYKSLDEAIRGIFGSGRRVVQRKSVFGGDINQAAALTLDDGRTVFMKSNAPDRLADFMAETEGLEAIRKTGAISAPEVFGAGKEAGFSFLLMEFISEGRQIRNYWDVFAAELAAMHAADVGSRFGFTHENRIGATRQLNTPHDSWIAFFRDCRLAPQFDMAAGYLSVSDRQRAGQLLSHLDRYLIEPERPSLVHGDLWAGNMITGKDGKGWLIDPAVYWGHPEADIAMTELFGGFPRQFYEAYRTAGHLERDYSDRRDIYNLYHLLNHLNMFGSGYLGSVRRILNRYAG